MSIQHPNQRTTMTKCAYCGQEMSESSPLGEHRYWESDGVGGLVSSCRQCARDMGTRQARHVTGD
jgi:hypothetical protein